jgi:RNA polymerase sigma-70 factor (ECF subfamily)
VTNSQDSSLIARLRVGDEDAFAHLVDLHGPALLRVARMYVSGHAAAEDVVQDTWLGLIDSLDRFEGRASLKTWIFRILINCARKRAGRDRRHIPLSSFSEPDPGGESSVDPDRFFAASHRWAHHWKHPPHPWDHPEEHLLSAETRARLEDAIQCLPEAQRQVVTLRDVEGWSAPQVCDALGITDANQRVLLHRARSKLRGALDEYLSEEGAN